jgi:hypothetical protein
MVWPGANTSSMNSVNFTENLSGVKYIAGSNIVNDRIWGADNDGVIWKLKWQSNLNSWVADPVWGSKGRPLVLFNAIGEKYDSEGIAFGNTTDLAYFCIERYDFAIERPENKGTTRLSILQFSTATPKTTGSTLPVLKEWVLTSVFPVITLNKGLEALTIIPNNYLEANGFKNSSGALFNPKDYPLQVAGGVFFTGLEATGDVYAFVLNSDLTFVLLAKFNSGETKIMELEFDPTTGYLWTLCDNGCAGRSHVLTITDGVFTNKATITPPSTTMTTMNLEGFTIEPESRCNKTTNRKFAYWADDDTGILTKAGIKCGVEAKFLSLFPRPIVYPNPF